MSDVKPENAQTPPVRVADTLEAAAGVLGCSVGLLQKLKGIGCPAFRGSRVYLEELESYIENNPEVRKWEQELEEADRLNVEILRERHRKLRFANDVEEGRYSSKETVSPLLEALAIEQKRVLRRYLEDELPLRIEGKSAADIRPIMRSVVDDVCAVFSRGTRGLHQASES